MNSVLRVTMTSVLMSVAAWADVAAVQAEPNLEKRSEAALVHAQEELQAARKAYDAGELNGFEKALNEVAELAELSLKSLEDTGKRARRSPRYWKRAEQRLLGLMRQLDSLEKAVSVDDRGTVERVRKRVTDTHDAILNAIMTKK